MTRNDTNEEILGRGHTGLVAPEDLATSSTRVFLTNHIEATLLASSWAKKSVIPSN